MRVLHVVELPGPVARRRATGHPCEAMLAWCAAAASEGDIVAAIGSANEALRARALGLEAAVRVAAPMRCTPLAARALRQRAGAGFERVICWGIGSAACARLAYGNRARRVVVAAGVRASGAGERVLRFALRGARVVALDAESADAAREIAADVREEPLGFHLAGPRDGETRESIRAQFGIGPSDLVVVLLADPPGAGDAFRFIFTVGFLDRADRRVVGVISARSGELERSRRLHRATAQTFRIVATDRPIASVVAACDIGLWEGGTRALNGSRPRPTALDLDAIGNAMACGLAVVAIDRPEMRAVFPAGVADRCLARGAGMTELARRLLPLAVDAGERARIGRVLGAHAQSTGRAGSLRGTVSL